MINSKTSTLRCNENLFLKRYNISGFASLEGNNSVQIDVFVFLSGINNLAAPEVIV